MDYRDVLLDTFNQRRVKNSAYSMRAYARDIDISPSRLSEIFSGKGELSLVKSVAIAKRLNLSPLKAANFKDMVIVKTSRNLRQQTRSLNRLKAVISSDRRKNLTEDQFRLMSSPKYSAVYASMMLETFEGDIPSLAKLFDYPVIAITLT